MGLKIIPSDFLNFEPGEKRVVNKLNSLYLNVDYDCYLYIQPRLEKLNTDFLLIDAYKGICIIEVKDWNIGSIDRTYALEVQNQAQQALGLNLYFKQLKV